MKWLRRDCHVLALHYGLCLTEKDFRAEMKRLGVKQDVNFGKHEHSNATTHFFVSNEIKHIALVTMRQDSSKSLEQCYSLLVHEAVHIWQEHCELIGENKPSSEFESYAIQTIAQALMIAYRDMKNIRKHK